MHIIWGEGKERERFQFPPDEGHVLVSERRLNVFHDVPQRGSQLPETNPEQLVPETITSNLGTGLGTITGKPFQLKLAIPSEQWFTTKPALWDHPRSFKNSDAQASPPETDLLGL